MTTVNNNAHGASDQLGLAISLVVLGETFLVLMGAVVKHLGNDMPVSQILFIRHGLSLIYIFTAISRIGYGKLKTPRFGQHVIRSLVGIGGMASFFYTYTQIQLSEAVLLKAMTPFFVPISAYFILKERVTAITLLSIFVAFGGVVVIVGMPEVEAEVQFGFMVGLAGAIFASLAKVMVRKIAKEEPVEIILFYFSFFGMLATAPLAVINWVPMSWEQWGWMLALASTATLGQFLITKAFSHAPAAKISFYTYTALPIAGLLGWYFWGEEIYIELLLGSILIFVGGGINFLFSRSQPRRTDIS